MKANSSSVINLPECFRYPPFFKVNQLSVKADLSLTFKDSIVREPFIYDILLYNGYDAAKPWQNSGIFVPILLEEWKKEEQVLTACFKERRGKGNEELMTSSISFFIIFICWANDQPVETLESHLTWLEQKKVKPVNVKERLRFIIENPTQFHSFIQLQQLFQELAKHFIKKEALKKINKKNP
ncbi:YpoC family protein [Metabacillus sp. RGM 3146]|uniref:YpoC family protein n=1 Tax=Metabacillus sp. RGM 3146 TaxID=3401092 RepID=UPI003B9BBDC3